MKTLRLNLTCEGDIETINKLWSIISMNTDGRLSGDLKLIKFYLNIHEVKEEK